ncbi:MAG: MBL fold metallo-hydrolase [Bacteriovoracaceae bacterium]|nr:MBL fold metallo-hydrolase [Bacteriovoracaceae bacterium]
MFKLLLLFFPLLAFSYPESDHFNGKKFFNPGPDELKSFWQVLKWQIIGNKEEWPQSVPNKNYPLRPLGGSEKVSATFINHSSFLMQLPGLNVLTDPVYSERVSPITWIGPKRVRAPGIPFELLPQIDVVIISHNHYDHLDLETLKMLDAKYHPLFLVPLGDEKHLGKAGIQNVKALDWWEEVRVKDNRFIFTPSKHWSARHLWDKNECLWGSFVIDNGTSKIYFAGDTGYSSHFLDIKRRLGVPDLAFLPIGAYEPQWFMKAYHMNPEEAVLAHKDLEAVKSIAIHFGTFQLSDEAIDGPVKGLKEAMEKHQIPKNDFIILDQGQALVY